MNVSKWWHFGIFPSALIAPPAVVSELRVQTFISDPNLIWCISILSTSRDISDYRESVWIHLLV